MQSDLCSKVSLSQTANFRRFQTEKVCRRQFQIWRKWQKVTQMGRKLCVKRRNCSLRAISPFHTVISKGLFPRGIKTCHCVGMGYSLQLLGATLFKCDKPWIPDSISLTFAQISPCFYVSVVQVFRKHSGKQEIAQKEQFLHFPQCFLAFLKNFSPF